MTMFVQSVEGVEEAAVLDEGDDVRSRAAGD